MKEQNKPLTFSYSTVLLSTLAALLNLAISSRAYAQPNAPTSGDVEPFALSAREQELRRKEAELLSAIQGSVSSSDQVQVIPLAPSHASDSSPVITLEGQSSDVYSDIQPDGPRNALRVLEHHPALSATPPRIAPPPAASASSSGLVKTHFSESHPDGTTARRIGTFTRVTRGYNRSGNYPRETSRTHTVSLNSIQSAGWVRPASLSSEEIATIRSSSTVLRAGPARLDTNLARVPQYSEVAIDYRRGDWYRIKTDRGVRGWVPGTTLLFDAGVSPVSTVRIGAVKGKIR